MGRHDVRTEDAATQKFDRNSAADLKEWLYFSCLHDAKVENIG